VDPLAIEKLCVSDYVLDGSSYNNLLEVLVFQLLFCFGLWGWKEVICLIGFANY
jgi:hypothetical protein